VTREEGGGLAVDGVKDGLLGGLGGVSAGMGGGNGVRGGGEEDAGVVGECGGGR